MSDNEILKFEINGLTEFLKALEETPRTIAPLAKKAMQLSVKSIVGRAREYPEATEANLPRTWISGEKHTWYERGYGPKWVVKSGEVHGNKTSRKLGKQWTTQVTTRRSGVIGTVGNSAKYAPYVQGDQQMSYHAAHGWITLTQAVEDSEEDILAAWSDAVDTFLQQLTGTQL